MEQTSKSQGDLARTIDSPANQLRILKTRFTELVEATNSGDRIKILGYTNKVPELMAISSYVITKPGGLTVTECLASKLPIVIINPIPGQEEENATFLVENDVAIWIKKVIT